MAPDQLIGIGIAGQVKQGQLAAEPRNVFFDRERLVGWQSVKDQMQGLADLRIIRRSKSTNSGPVKAPA